jgi:hypothetical protein
MFTLLKHQGAKKFFTAEMPSLGGSLLISEALFKFGSFTLECAAFLATWYAFSFVINHILTRRKTAIS